MHVVPPPITGNYMPSGPDIEVDYSQFTYEPSELVSELIVNESNVECQPKVWSDAPIIEECELDSEDEYVSIPTKQQETPSFANQQVKTPRETVKNQFTHSQKPKVDKKELAVLTRTGKIPVNTARASGTKNVSTARQSFNRQAVLTSTAMKVNTVKPIVNRVRPANVFHKTHSPSSRPFKKTTVLSTNFSKQKVNTAKVNAVSAVGGKRETAVKPSAGCNWRAQRYNWHNISKYNGGSSLRNCYTFKDPLGRLKPKQAWGVSAHDGNKAYLADFTTLMVPLLLLEVVKEKKLDSLLREFVRLLGFILGPSKIPLGEIKLKVKGCGLAIGGAHGNEFFEGKEKKCRKMGPSGHGRRPWELSYRTGRSLSPLAIGQVIIGVWEYNFVINGNKYENVQTQDRIMAIRRKLQTQDRIMAWNNNNDMKCSLCSMVKDSHNHLTMLRVIIENVKLQLSCLKVKSPVMLIKLLQNGMGCLVDYVLPVFYAVLKAKLRQYIFFKPLQWREPYSLEFAGYLFLFDLYDFSDWPWEGSEDRLDMIKGVCFWACDVCSSLFLGSLCLGDVVFGEWDRIRLDWFCVDVVTMGFRLDIVRFADEVIVDVVESVYGLTLSSLLPFPFI
ncbi:hypothetical protein Tco_0745139 [Tanacetum coccineum]